MKGKKRQTFHHEDFALSPAPVGRIYAQIWIDHTNKKAKEHKLKGKVIVVDLGKARQ